MDKEYQEIVKRFIGRAPAYEGPTKKKKAFGRNRHIGHGDF